MTTEIEQPPESVLGINREPSKEAVEAEASERAIYDKLAAGLETPADEAEAPDEQPDEDTPPAEKPEVDDAKPAPAASEDATKARAYLKLKGVADKALDALAPEELAEMRARFLERETAYDRLLQENAEFRKTAQTEEAATKTEPAVPAVELDLGAIKAELAEEFGEDAATKLESAFKAVVEPLAKELQDAKRALHNQAQATEAQTMEAVRAKLRDEFPDIVDPDKYAAVCEDMKVLVARPKYRQYPTAEEAFSALMRDAAVLSGLEAKTAAPEPTEAKPEAPATPSRNASQPATPGKQPKTGREKTSEQLQRLVYKGLEKGLTPEQARREAGIE